MSDRISTYRQVRLVVQIPQDRASRSYWSLHAIGVQKGVPTSRILLDGYVPALDPNCTTEEILEAVHAASTQGMLG